MQRLLQRFKCELNKYKRVYTQLCKHQEGASWKQVMQFVKIVYCHKVTNINIFDLQRFPQLLSTKERESYFTNAQYVYFCEHINQQKALYLVRQKHLLLTRLAHKIERQWIYLPEANEEDVREFLAKVSDFLLKPDDLAFGKGIAKCQAKNGFVELIFPDKSGQKYDYHGFYRRYHAKNYLLEEYIRQHPVISAIYPQCVNSIRIHSINLHGKAEIVELSSLKIGQGEFSVTDHTGYTSVGIKPDGRLYSRDYFFNSDTHPDTGVKFDSIILPYWQECLNLVKEAALLVPELTYIGWDVAITLTGPTIIEGNGEPASYNIQQTYELQTRGYGIAKEKQALLNRVLSS